MRCGYSCVVLPLWWWWLALSGIAPFAFGMKNGGKGRLLAGIQTGGESSTRPVMHVGTSGNTIMEHWPVDEFWLSSDGVWKVFTKKRVKSFEMDPWPKEIMDIVTSKPEEKYVMCNGVLFKWMKSQQRRQDQDYAWVRDAGEIPLKKFSCPKEVLTTSAHVYLLQIADRAGESVIDVTGRDKRMCADTGGVTRVHWIGFGGEATVHDLEKYDASLLFDGIYLGAASMKWSLRPASDDKNPMKSYYRRVVVGHGSSERRTAFRNEVGSSQQGVEDSVEIYEPVEDGRLLGSGAALGVIGTKLRQFIKHLGGIGVTFVCNGKVFVIRKAIFNPKEKGVMVLNEKLKKKRNGSLWSRVKWKAASVPFAVEGRGTSLPEDRSSSPAGYYLLRCDHNKKQTINKQQILSECSFYSFKGASKFEVEGVFALYDKDKKMTWTKAKDVIPESDLSDLSNDVTTYYNTNAPYKYYYNLVYWPMGRFLAT